MTRIPQQKKLIVVVNKANDHTALAVHSNSHNHTFNVDSLLVLAHENNDKNRRSYNYAR